MYQRCLVRIQVLTDAGENAAKLAALGFNLLALTRQSPHVGGGSTKIRNNSREAWACIANLFNLAHDRVFGTILDNAPFVLRDRTKGAAAKTPSHDIDRV